MDRDEARVPRRCRVRLAPFSLRRHRASRAVFEGIAGRIRLVHSLEIVTEAKHQQTEIGIAEALAISPEALVGDTLEVSADVRHRAIQDVLRHGGSLAAWHRGPWHEGQVFVAFEAEVVQLNSIKESLGTIRDGSATYPTDPIIPRELHAVIAGFDLLISSLTITPKGAIGAVTATLPGGIFSPDACRPAEIDLGRVRLGPNCEIYAERPDQAYGPWLLADTGLEIEGTGFILDLSTTGSPGGLPPGWRGVQLLNGSATGKRIVPDPCNTGYLRGTYAYYAATVDVSGFDGNVVLDQPCTFEALNPRRQVVTIMSGSLQVTHSVVSSGVLGPGDVSLPTDADLCGRTRRHGHARDHVRRRSRPISMSPRWSTTGAARSPGATSPMLARNCSSGWPRSRWAISTCPPGREPASLRRPRPASSARASRRSRARASPTWRSTAWPGSRSQI